MLHVLPQGKFLPPPPLYVIVLLNWNLLSAIWWTGEQFFITKSDCSHIFPTVYLLKSVPGPTVSCFGFLSTLYNWQIIDNRNCQSSKYWPIKNGEWILESNLNWCWEKELKTRNRLPWSWTARAMSESKEQNRLQAGELLGSQAGSRGRTQEAHRILLVLRQLLTKWTCISHGSQPTQTLRALICNLTCPCHCSSAPLNSPVTQFPAFRADLRGIATTSPFRGNSCQWVAQWILRPVLQCLQTSQKKWTFWLSCEFSNIGSDYFWNTQWAKNTWVYSQQLATHQLEDL